MDVSGIGLFHLAEQRLAWIDQRQRVLATNVANADTPGWKSRDISPFAQALQQSAAPLAMTDPGHLAPPAATTGSATQRSERAPDGNAVAI